MPSAASIIAAIQDYVYATHPTALDVRVSLDNPARGPLLVRGERLMTGQAYGIPGFLDSVVHGIADALSGSDPVASLAALAALPTDKRADGTVVYVTEVRDLYVLDKTNLHVVDGLTVIAGSGGGYWVARAVGRWEDLQAPAGQAPEANTLIAEGYRDAPFHLHFLRHDADNALSFVFQLPHRWRYANAIRPHLHVIPAASPLTTENVRFSGRYAWSHYGGAMLPAWGDWTNFTVDLPVTSSLTFVQLLVPLGTLTPPAYARASTCLCLWVQRESSNLADTYKTSKIGGTPAANLAILGADVHYRVENAAGSEREIPT